MMQADLKFQDRIDLAALSLYNFRDYSDGGVLVNGGDLKLVSGG
jgi:hypothetical protein